MNANFPFSLSLQTLTLIEFLVKNGSERTVDAAKDHIYKIRNLESFSFYEGNIDKGSGVREKSKQLIELLQSNEMIREERDKARSLRNKFVGISNNGGGGSYSSGGGGSYDSRDNYSTGRYNDSYSSSNHNSYDQSASTGIAFHCHFLQSVNF